MTVAAGVQEEAGLDPAALGDELAAEGWRVFVLPEGMADKAAFFDGVREVLPLDPPLASDNWDGLSDALFGGLHGLGADRVAILWPGAGGLRDGAPDDFAIARDVLADLAGELGDADTTDEDPTHVAVVLG